MSQADESGAVILVVDDEPRYLRWITVNLRASGYRVLTATDGQAALEITAAERPDLVLLDIGLPVLNGLEVCRQIREFSTVPIIMLTAKAAEADKVAGLDAGADDYLPKPFALAELIARVRAMGRRGGEARAAMLQVADLTLDTITRVARRGETTVELTAREYRLLEFLMRSEGRVCGRMTILEKVWDYDFDPGTNLVDVYVRRLREKIDADFSPRLIHTVRGAGYVLRETP